MSTRKRRDMTTRQDSSLSSIKPEILPGNNRKTSIILRSFGAATEDIEIIRTNTGLEIRADPDGANTLLGTLPSPDTIWVWVNKPGPGNKAYVIAPFSGTITGWKIWGDVSGSAVVDVWKRSFGGTVPTNSDSITSATPVSVTSSVSNSGSPTGWTTAVTRGDMLIFNTDSSSSFNNIVIGLEITR